MSAVCPACGVAVVPGYVRCPKCHAGLPAGLGRTKRMTGDPGGTALPQRSFPVSAVVVALAVAAVIILVFGLRGTSPKIEAALPAAPEPIEATNPNPPSPPIVRAPVAVQVPAAAAAPDPGPAIAELKAALRAQRLWGSVDILGQRIDVRSGSCSDPAMGPLVEAKKSLLHGAGLTKLRCLEQSGAVVFERDL